MKLLETSIPANYSEIVKAMGLLIEPTYTDDLLSNGFTSIAHFMQLVKTKGKTALRLTDENNVFLFAAVVSYQPNDDEEMPGNYTFEFCFDEDDIENADKFEMDDKEFTKILTSVCFTSSNMKFTSDTNLIYTFKYLFKSLVEWLKTNDGEVEHDKFVAVSAVEDDEKVMSITPDGVLKRLIKDDASAEPAA